MLIDETTYAPGKQADLEAPLRPLKPSEAIRLGAAMRPQCRVTAFRNGGSCAIGAWFEGMGYGSDRNVFNLKRGYTLFKEATNIDPLQVTKQNDNGWTREQIADWLAKQGL